MLKRAWILSVVLPALLPAALLRIEVSERSDVLDGKPFASAGPYTARKAIGRDALGVSLCQQGRLQLVWKIDGQGHWALPSHPGYGMPVCLPRLVRQVAVRPGQRVALMRYMNDAVRIAVIGDFNPEYATHHAINASLGHAADALGVGMESKWVATGCVERDADKILRNYEGLFIASGSPYRSMEGAFAAIRFARTQRWPLIGT